jgi:hypothetical protein
MKELCGGWMLEHTTDIKGSFVNKLKTLLRMKLEAHETINFDTDQVGLKYDFH